MLTLHGVVVSYAEERSNYEEGSFSIKIYIYNLYVL
jgi:hypothetical protein